MPIPKVTAGMKFCKPWQLLLPFQAIFPAQPPWKHAILHTEISTSNFDHLLFPGNAVLFKALLPVPPVHRQQIL